MNALACRGTVFLVDDDTDLLRALGRLLREDGWQVETFASAEEFLVHPAPPGPACLVLDVHLPGLDGFELQDRLSASGQRFPIVFLTGYGDIPLSVRAIRAGAIDFLTKPVHGETLLRAVRLARTASASAWNAATAPPALRARFEGLTPREREVLQALSAGKINKQIARDLGIVEQTVKFHRARVMARMEAHSVAELMHMAARLGIGPRH